MPDRAGKRWAMQAAGGRVGRFRSAMWVEVMVVLSGRCTVIMGVGVTRMLMMLASAMARKWPVLLVSAMREDNSGEGPSIDRHVVLKLTGLV